MDVERIASNILAFLPKIKSTKSSVGLKTFWLINQLQILLEIHRHIKCNVHCTTNTQRERTILVQVHPAHCSESNAGGKFHLLAVLVQNLLEYGGIS